MKKRGLKLLMLRVLARQLQIWTDFVFRKVREEERPVQRKQANAASTDMGSVDADTPPAHWLARVQRDAPELLRQREHFKGKAVMQSPLLPATHPSGESILLEERGMWGERPTDEGKSPPRSMGDRSDIQPPGLRPPTAPPRSRPYSVRGQEVQRGDDRSWTDTPPAEWLAQVQRDVPEGEMTNAEKGSGRQAEIGKQDGEERRGRRGEELVRSREPKVYAMPAPEGWLGLAVKPDSSAGEEGIRSVRQARQDLWPQAGISLPVHEQRAQVKASEQIEMCWPSLPDEETSNSQDWEMALRVWERQQRLDEEQRGSLWNG